MHLYSICTRSALSLSPISYPEFRNAKVSTYRIILSLSIVHRRPLVGDLYLLRGIRTRNRVRPSRVRWWKNDIYDHRFPPTLAVGQLPSYVPAEPESAARITHTVNTRNTEYNRALVLQYHLFSSPLCDRRKMAEEWTTT